MGGSATLALARSSLNGRFDSRGLKRKCGFCGKVRKSISLGELADRVHGVIETHFRLTPSDPYSEEYAYDKEVGWERRGEPVEYLIAEIAGVEQELAVAIRKTLSERTAWDAHEGGYEDPYGIEAHYEVGKPDTYDFRESWDFFRRQIKTSERYFGQFAKRALDEIFGDDLDRLKTWQGDRAVRTIFPESDDRFFLPCTGRPFGKRAT